MKHRCPICKVPTDSARDGEFPFCSERCRMLDLGAWANEEYAVCDPIFDEDELPEADRRALHHAREESDETIQ